MALFGGLALAVLVGGAAAAQDTPVAIGISGWTASRP